MRISKIQNGRQGASKWPTGLESGLFYPNAPSMRKGDDGGEKKNRGGVNKGGENGEKKRK